MSLVFRPVSVADAALLGGLNAELIEAETCHPPDQSRESLCARMQAWLEGGLQGVIVRLAAEPGQVVGYALFSWDEGHIYLRHFLVREPFRRRGVGRAFFRHLTDSVFPAKPLVVESLFANPGAVAFWRSFGFEDYYVGLRRPVDAR